MNAPGASEVFALMVRYASILDRRELEVWPDFFTEDARYAVASSENLEAGLPLKLIDDGSKSKILDRVRYVREFWEGSYNDYVPRHILSAPIVLDADAQTVRFEQSFALYATDTDVSSNAGGVTSLLCVGHYAGCARREGEDLKLADLEAILDTFAIGRSLVYPC